MSNFDFAICVTLLRVFCGLSGGIPFALASWQFRSNRIRRCEDTDRMAVAAMTFVLSKGLRAVW